jgi:mono/diheme cytochrome c family protein
MATRLTGLTRGRDLGRPIAAVRAWSRLRKFALGGVALLAILAACESTNTYPVDIYTGMHYQHSYRTLEPPRFLGPEEAVPISGRAPSYTSAEILQLENPTPADAASIERGGKLFTVNCVECHGEGGNGDGVMAKYFVDNGARPPAVLTADRLVQVEDNYFYNTLTNGLPPYMPSFANLLEGNEIWDLVNYIRTLQAAAR